MHLFLAVYYFMLPLLHVSTQLFHARWVTCESNAIVDKTLRYTLLYVCYVDAWHAPMYLVTCLLCGRLVCTDLSGYVSVMWTPGIHRSVWLRVCYVDAWYAPICLVTLPRVYSVKQANKMPDSHLI
jgi:hypothetical protein